ncbi:MAG: hypothetical protein JRH15_17825 [Deltaproteobacteria bacterium]|nr:hypothetical protein [Deltaproteobacteria bacterium]
MVKKRIGRLLIALCTIGLIWGGDVWALSTDIGGNTLNVQGYISQTVQFGIDGDDYDTKEGFNAALTNLFIEGDYSFAGDWSIYAAGMFTMDWAYEVLHDDDDWKSRHFNESRSELFMDDEWWQLLKEAHVTWQPGNFMFRVGKQRVAWGAMDLFAVTNVINPVDLTHGFADLELDTLFIPIPLVRAEYAFDAIVGPLADIGIQFVFNPNVDHIPDAGSAYGNNTAGIWAADIVFKDPDPANELRLFNLYDTIEEPDAFDSEFFEYGLRAYATLLDNMQVSLMGFYGKQNAPILAFFDPSSVQTLFGFDDKGRPIIDTLEPGSYADQKFIGASMAAELPVSIRALGGFRPMFRLAARYEFDHKYYDGWNLEFFETDLIVAGFNAEYKIKVPWQRNSLFFAVEGQYNHATDHRPFLMDETQIFRENDYWYNFFALLSSSYMRGKLIPSIEWYAIYDGDAYIVSPQIVYTINERWNVKVRGNFFGGTKISNDAIAGHLGLDDKDNVAFKIQYNWQ